MGLCGKEGLEDQVIVTESFADDGLVETVEIEYAYFALHPCHIFDDLDRQIREKMVQNPVEPAPAAPVSMDGDEDDDIDLDEEDEEFVLDA